jgi:drug/metabolite transporter (DMT)-like permease
MPSTATWLALLGTATLATALAYIIFFRILVRSGASNVMLVTLLIPVTAILLGHFLLGEPLEAREIAGACIIGGALVIVDGRIGRWLPIREARARLRPGAQPPPAPGGRGARGHTRR